MSTVDLHGYAEPAVLRDGGSILVRAVAPSDKPLLLEMFRRLSPDSVRHRVFGLKKGLSDQDLAYLTELDFVKHVGFAAVLRERGEERIIGVGRYIRSHPHGEAVAPAELAFAVVDEHQGRGIGTVLLEHLARAALAAGVDQLEADVMADNTQMMRVFRDSGFVVRRSLQDCIFHVAFLTSDTEAFARARSSREHQAAAAARAERLRTAPA